MIIKDAYTGKHAKKTFNFTTNHSTSYLPSKGR